MDGGGSLAFRESSITELHFDQKVLHKEFLMWKMLNSYQSQGQHSSTDPTSDRSDSWRQWWMEILRMLSQIPTNNAEAAIEH